MDEDIPGIIGGRPIVWCAGGAGNTAYCPRPTDPDEYTYCCAYGYDPTIPTCCRFSTFTGLLYAYYFGAIVAAALLIFLTCWCCPICPLAKHVQSVSERKRCTDEQESRRNCNIWNQNGNRQRSTVT